MLSVSGANNLAHADEIQARAVPQPTLSWLFSRSRKVWINGSRLRPRRMINENGAW
ncbi:hypothetical protein D3C79_1037680 [compost metagenome]